MQIEHPIITNMERTGNPQGRIYDPRNICPVCGKWCNTFFLYPAVNEIIGCENCVRDINSEDYYDEDQEEDYE